MSDPDKQNKEKELMEKEEKRILKTSFVGCVLFLIAEFIMAVITDSKALIMDCIWDGSDLIMLVPMIIVVSLLKKPISEKRPFGFSQVESILLVIKSTMLTVITCMLIVDGIESIIHGGNMVDGVLLAVYQLVICVICTAMYVTLKRRANKINSPTVLAELFIWKLDAFSTLGVGIGFIIQVLLTKSQLAWTAPYIDPIIAIIMAFILLREPIKIAVINIRNLVLFAPEKEIRDEIHQVVEAAFAETELKNTFIDIVQTGRKIWLDIYFTKSSSDMISFKKLTKIRDIIYSELVRLEYDDIDVTLTPDLNLQQNV